MSDETDKFMFKVESSGIENAELVAQAYQPSSKRLNGTITKTDHVGMQGQAQLDTSKSGKYFEGQKAYVFLLDADGNGFPDQMTGPYSLIYTLPESTQAGPVHSRVGFMNPAATLAEGKSETAPKDEHRVKKFHFEGTITIPNVKVTQGSLAGETFTVQFDEPNFEFPFIEEGPSDTRLHKVTEQWVPARIVPKEKSPIDPMSDGYLFVDE
ncbi:MAG: hypothetical protein K2Y22_16770 [Candidatus Obscuribacterales bacterium]|nr:hypothetical protein [Candidatus Obscuribacterales bacterium]